jgi:acyl dehydratase
VAQDPAVWRCFRGAHLEITEADVSETAVKLYLEDLTVGQTFRSTPQPVTAEGIIKFATQFDPQPFHLDERQAQETFFQGLAASGWHTASIAMRLLVDSVPLAGGVIGTVVEELRWLKPVRPDDAFGLESEVLEIQPGNRPRGLVKLRAVSVNQHGEVVQVLTATLLVSKRPDIDPAAIAAFGSKPL